MQYKYIGPEAQRAYNILTTVKVTMTNKKYVQVRNFSWNTGSIVGFSSHKDSYAVCASGSFKSHKNGQQELKLPSLIASNSLQSLPIKKSSKVINKGNGKQQIIYIKTIQSLVRMIVSKDKG
jgi:hypothetical protein